METTNRKKKNYSSANVLAKKEKKKIERPVKFGTFIAVVSVLCLTLFLAYGGLRYASFWLEDKNHFELFANSDVCAWFEKIFNLKFIYVSETSTSGNFTFTLYGLRTEWIEMYGRFILIGVINLLACFCFRRGKDARISGGNIFIFVLAFLALWIWFMEMDTGAGWLNGADSDQVRVVMICDILLFLYCILSFITLCLAHKSRLFESKNKRVNRRENGKVHTGVAVVAFLITWQPILLPIIFLLFVITRIIKVKKQTNMEIEEALEESLDEEYIA